MVFDRDHNAAVNLARLAERSRVPASTVVEPTVQAALVAVKPESRNGSASPQGEAA